MRFEALLKFEWMTYGEIDPGFYESAGLPPPLSPPPGAGQSSPPDGLWSQAQQGFAWPGPSSVGVHHAASRMGFARLDPA